MGKSEIQLLDAAGKVFAEKGYDRSTVREICSLAGVNVSAVNYHFGDKERLYIEAVKSARNALEEGTPLPDAVELRDPEDALRVVIQTLVHRILDPNVESWRHQLLVREFMNPSRACEEMMQESIRPFWARLTAIIKRNLPSDVAEPIVQQLAFSILSQAAYYRLQDRVVAMLVPENELQKHFTTESLANHITEFSLAAIKNYSCQENIAKE